MHLRCPIDGSALSRVGKRVVVCAQNHPFDLARNGYLNLLLPQHKRSKQPGDSPEMIAARRRFLNEGHYRKIADQVNADFIRHHYHYHHHHHHHTQQPQPQPQPQNEEATRIRIIDLGCGEGYYLRTLAAALESQGVSHEAFGIDISKAAIKAAAGAGAGANNNKDCTWIVGSTRLLPFEDAFADAQICLFFNPDWQAVLPKLKPNGSLILVSPTRTHLLELRELIYGDVVRTEKEEEPTINPALSPVARTLVQYQFTLGSNERIQDLLTMTPHYWRATKEAKQRLAEVSAMTLTCSVNVRVFRKSPRSC